MPVPREEEKCRLQVGVSDSQNGFIDGSDSPQRADCQVNSTTTNPMSKFWQQFEGMSVLYTLQGNPITKPTIVPMVGGVLYTPQGDSYV